MSQEENSPPTPPVEAPGETTTAVVDDAPEQQQRQQKPKRLPPYHVVLWNDDDHTFEYVIGMMRKLFGHPLEMGAKIADEVHNRGRAIVMTTTKELAELKRDQIHAFGKDEVAGSQGSMSSTIEPAPG
jgi:ATP-dependent Clp protease adaptor protein ClpS